MTETPSLLFYHLQGQPSACRSQKQYPSSDNSSDLFLVNLISHNSWLVLEQIISMESPHQSPDPSWRKTAFSSEASYWADIFSRPQIIICFWIPVGQTRLITDASYIFVLWQTKAICCFLSLLQLEICWQWWPRSPLVLMAASLFKVSCSV